MSHDDKIAAIQKEVDILKARVDDIFAAVKFESDSKTDHLSRLYDDIVEIHEYLAPVMHKLFPKIGTDFGKIDALIRRRPPPDTKDT